MKILLAIIIVAAVAFALTRQRRPVPSLPPTPQSDTVELGADYIPNDGMGQWSLRFPATGPTEAAFDLVLGPKRPASSPDFAVASGFLRGHPGGAPNRFLVELGHALGAPAGVSRRAAADQLTLDVGILGERMSRGVSTTNPGRVVAGEFADNPPGEWLVTKLFLDDNQAEVFLALDPSGHRALLIKKDPEYGAAVVAELARLFH